MRRAWLLLVLAACSGGAAPPVVVPSTPVTETRAVELAIEVCDEMRAEVLRHESEVQQTRSFASVMPVIDTALGKLGAIRTEHDATARALDDMRDKMAEMLAALRQADPLLSTSDSPAEEPEVRAFEAAKQAANAAARAARATSCEISP